MWFARIFLHVTLFLQYHIPHSTTLLHAHLVALITDKTIICTVTYIHRTVQNSQYLDKYAFEKLNIPTVRLSPCNTQRELLDSQR